MNPITFLYYPCNFYSSFLRGEDLAFPHPSARCPLAALLLPHVLQSRAQMGQRGLAITSPASRGAEGSQLVSCSSHPHVATPTGSLHSPKSKSVLPRVSWDPHQPQEVSAGLQACAQLYLCSWLSLSIHGDFLLVSLQHPAFSSRSPTLANLCTHPHMCKVPGAAPSCQQR